MRTCEFDLAWRRGCDNEADSSGYCGEHKGMSCTVCEAQATHECPEAGSLVCGARLCDNCEGYQDRDGRNSGFRGFIGTGVHRHRRKNE